VFSSKTLEQINNNVERRQFITRGIFDWGFLGRGRIVPLQELFLCVIGVFFLQDEREWKLSSSVGQRLASCNFEFFFNIQAAAGEKVCLQNNKAFARTIFAVLTFEGIFVSGND